MAKWQDQWLTDRERKYMQLGQQGITARERIQKDKENRGYPKSSIPISQPDKVHTERGIAAGRKRAGLDKPTELKRNPKGSQVSKENEAKTDLKSSSRHMMGNPNQKSDSMTKIKIKNAFAEASNRVKRSTKR